MSAIERLSPGTLWNDFINIGSLASYSSGEALSGEVMGVIFAVLAIYTFFSKNLIFLEKKIRFKASADDIFFILGLTFLIFYFYAPDGIANAMYINSRLNLYPFLIILPWLNPDMRRPVKFITGACLVILILFRLGSITLSYKAINEGLTEYTSAERFIGKNETLLTMSFDHRGDNSLIIAPYLHAGDYCCLSTGAISLNNYEANRDYFPLRYKKDLNPYRTIGRLETVMGKARPRRYPIPIDNILLWSRKGSFQDLEWIEKNYKPVHKEGRVTLYKRR